jgi:DnaJ-class molecular chaperone
MQFKDYYQILGVAKGASQDDIKKAYRKLARKYHPDVSKEADAAQRMAELNEANAVLSDPEKRAAYDSVGAQAWARRRALGRRRASAAGLEHRLRVLGRRRRRLSRPFEARAISASSSSRCSAVPSAGARGARAGGGMRRRRCAAKTTTRASSWS